MKVKLISSKIIEPISDENYISLNNELLNPDISEDKKVLIKKIMSNIYDFQDSVLPETSDLEVLDLEYYVEDNKVKIKFNKIINKYNIYQKIESLKQELANTDYKVIKQYEAVITNSELPYSLSEFEIRKNIRVEIENLEKMLKETV